jgi:hypothetical protein
MIIVNFATTTIINAADTRTVEECELVLKACDKAITGLEKETKLLREGLVLSGKALEASQAENKRLRARADAWYRENPALLFIGGVLIGGVAYGLLKD